MNSKLHGIKCTGKQNVQGKSFLQKLVLVNLMKIFNKNIFQCENMKSSFIFIGNLIQSTK